ncbi:hypothetical protein VHEMI09955 [[Torrubiella] hemipterigena]|nr:hypothetical protein VHEMI09955 [[Torrubiella] hemipterigena]
MQLEQELQQLRTSVEQDSDQPIGDSGFMEPSTPTISAPSEAHTIAMPPRYESTQRAGIAADASVERTVLGTLPRKLGDFELPPRKIDGCIKEFFEFYADNLEGLFHGLQNPNTLYEYSPVLFWTIVYVGSRNYTRDPTILERIISPLQSVFQQSLFDPEDAIPSIQSALLLCLWPFPVDTLFKLRTHVISGAAMMLAMQKGLHISGKAQDFVRVPLSQSNVEKEFRKTLWMHCQIVFQSNSIYDGLPPRLEMQEEHLDDSEIAAEHSFLVYHYHLHVHFMRRYRLILSISDLSTEIGLRIIDHAKISFQQDICLLVELIDISPLRKFAYHSAMLLFGVFYFFCGPGTGRDDGIKQAYTSAIAILSDAKRLDEQRGFANHATHAHLRIVSLAAVVVLRVMRSHLAELVEESPELAESLYFEAIQLSKKSSVRLNDLGGRNASILTQLWSSARLFQFKDGSVDGLKLLLRGRLCMSLVLDTHWWWRAEFGGKTNPYLESETAKSQEPSRANPVLQENNDTALEPQPLAIDPSLLPSFLDDALPNWNMDDTADFGLEWF